MQGLWANRDEPFGYGVINGTPVPEKYIYRKEVSSLVKEIILVSDGYPHLIVNNNINFGESEENLAYLLSIDPLCVNQLQGKKGLIKNNLAHDDRTWLTITR